MGTNDKINRERIRRINEEELNRLVGDASEDVMRRIIRKKLPDPSKSRQNLVKAVPKGLTAAVKSIGLLDEPDRKQRVVIFIGYCLDQKYSYNTTMRYITVLRNNGILENRLSENDAHIIQDKFVFSESGRPHTRVVSVKSFIKLITYLKANFSTYTAPLLVAYYTGLRNFEILQWTTVTLYQLKNQQPQVSVKRKNTLITKKNSSDAAVTYWEPVYTSHLVQFIDDMIQLYKDQYDQLLENNVKVKLFYILPNTVVNRVRETYYTANKTYPPRGFGIHSYRNMMATLMAQNTDNVKAIQTFLQHKNLKTTRKYINADFTHTVKEFERLTKYELSNVRKNLRITDTRSEKDDEEVR